MRYLPIVTVICLLCFLCASRAWLTANRPLSTLHGIMLNYSAIQLKKFNNYTLPSCTSVIKQLGLLRRPRYIHRSCRRKFVFSRSDHNISSIWSVASRTRHQGAVTPRTSSAGVSMTTLRTTDLDGNRRKHRVDLSLLRPIQRHTVA